MFCEHPADRPPVVDMDEFTRWVNADFSTAQATSSSPQPVLLLQQPANPGGALLNHDPSVAATRSVVAKPREDAARPPMRRQQSFTSNGSSSSSIVGLLQAPPKTGVATSAPVVLVQPNQHRRTVAEYQRSLADFNQKSNVADLLEVRVDEGVGNDVVQVVNNDEEEGPSLRIGEGEAETSAEEKDPLSLDEGIGGRAADSGIAASSMMDEFLTPD